MLLFTVSVDFHTECEGTNCYFITELLSMFDIDSVLICVNIRKVVTRPKSPKSTGQAILAYTVVVFEGDNYAC